MIAVVYCVIIIKHIMLFWRQVVSGRGAASREQVTRRGGGADCIPQVALTRVLKHVHTHTHTQHARAHAQNTYTHSTHNYRRNVMERVRMYLRALLYLYVVHLFCPILLYARPAPTRTPFH